MCVCGDLYTGDCEVIFGCCSCFFFFSQFIQQHLLTHFSICTTHTHTHTHTYHILYHSHILHTLTSYKTVHTRKYVHVYTQTHSHIIMYILPFSVCSSCSFSCSADSYTHKTHTKHTHTLTIWFQYGRMGEWNYLVSGCQFFKFRFLSSCLC